jgi:adenylate kinase family enzyme
VSERRIAVTSSASGSGKTTLARELARRLDVTYLELDALYHGPAWTPTPDDVLRALVEPVVRGDGWVIDGGYRSALGDLVFENADLIVWLDLPIRVWLPRLLRRTHRRVRSGEELWNGNVETWRTSFFSRDSLFVWAFQQHFRRRRLYPADLARFPVVRLRTAGDVRRFLAKVNA